MLTDTSTQIHRCTLYRGGQTVSWAKKIEKLQFELAQGDHGIDTQKSTA